MIGCFLDDDAKLLIARSSFARLCCGCAIRRDILLCSDANRVLALACTSASRAALRCTGFAELKQPGHPGRQIGNYVGKFSFLKHGAGSTTSDIAALRRAERTIRPIWQRIGAFGPARAVPRIAPLLQKRKFPDKIRVSPRRNARLLQKRQSQVARGSGASSSTGNGRLLGAIGAPGLFQQG